MAGAPGVAPRGQRTARTVGERPEPLEEVPEPQVGAVTVGYVAAQMPLLSAPVLADTVADAVDARTVKYLLKAALRRREEEEERKEWEMELARRDEQQRRVTEAMEKARAYLEPGRGSKRKRKKRRKRRLHRSSVPRGGRARRRQRQWLAPGWFSWCFAGLLGIFGIMVGLDQIDSNAARCLAHRRFFQWHVQDWAVPVCGSGPRCSASWRVWTRRILVQSVGFAGDSAPRAVFLSLSGPRCAASWPAWSRSTVMSVFVHLALFFFPSSGPRCFASWPVRKRRTVARGLWFRLQKTAESPQLHFIAGHRHPVRAAEADLHGPDYSADHRVSAVSRSYLLVDVPVMRVVQSLRCRRGEDIRAPTVAARGEIAVRGSDC